MARNGMAKMVVRLAWLIQRVKNLMDDGSSGGGAGVSSLPQAAPLGQPLSDDLQTGFGV